MQVSVPAKRHTAMGLALVALVAAGCGGSSNDDNTTSTQAAAPPPATETTTATTETTETTTTPAAGTGAAASGTLKLTADKAQLKYDKPSLEASAGKVTIDLTNPSPIPHDVAIKGNGVDAKSKIVQNGDETSVSAKLKPGTYTFYCTVDGHEAAGMKGTLTVK
jgi:plastocyanin